MKTPEIIGTSGFNGGGKDTLADVAVEVLAENGIRAVHLSGSDALRMVVRQRNKMAEDEPVPRELLGATSDALVRERGHPGALVLEIREQVDPSQTLVLSSVRRVGEAEAVKERGGITLFADALEEVRLERLKGRKRGDEVIDTIDDLRRTEAKERYGDPLRPGDKGVMCIQDVYNWIVNTYGSLCIVNNNGPIQELKIRTAGALACLLAE